MTDIFKVSDPVALDVIQDARKRMNGLNHCGAKAVDQLAISFRWSLNAIPLSWSSRRTSSEVWHARNLGGMMREIYPGMLGVVVQCGIKDRQRGCGGWSLKTGASEWG